MSPQWRFYWIQPPSFPAFAPVRASGPSSNSPKAHARLLRTLRRSRSDIVNIALTSRVLSFFHWCHADLVISGCTLLVVAWHLTKLIGSAGLMGMLTAARLVRLVGRTRFSVAGSSQSFAEGGGKCFFFYEGPFHES